MFVDDLWWLVYAIVFGVAFLIILMLIMFVCCLENAEENKYVTCFKIAKDCSFILWREDFPPAQYTSPKIFNNDPVLQKF